MSSTEEHPIEELMGYLKTMVKLNEHAQATVGRLIKSNQLLTNALTSISDDLTALGGEESERILNRINPLLQDAEKVLRDTANSYDDHVINDLNQVPDSWINKTKSDN